MQDSDRYGHRKDTPDARESGRPGGGQGRRDRVGGSGVYPPGAKVPPDAVIRTAGEWGEGAGGEEGGRSELHFSEEELRAAEEAEQAEEEQAEGGGS